MGFSRKPMRIFKWSPAFSYSKESAIAPVWINLPDLPLHLFSKGALYSIASIVGNPVKIDEPTANRSRPSIARVCVEIDLLKPPVDRVTIKSGQNIFEQRVFYEERPVYCTLCSHRGHLPEACFSNGNNLPPNKSKNQLRLTEKEKQKQKIPIQIEGAQTHELGKQAIEPFYPQTENLPLINEPNNTQTESCNHLTEPLTHQNKTIITANETLTQHTNTSNPATETRTQHTSTLNPTTETFRTTNQNPNKEKSTGKNKVQNRALTQKHRSKDQIKTHPNQPSSSQKSKTQQIFPPEKVNEQLFEAETSSSAAEITKK